MNKYKDNWKDKVKLYIDIIKDFTLLSVICLTIYGVWYSFGKYRLYTILGLALVVGIIWILDVTRILAFSVDKLFKRINSRWWDSMIRLNQFFNLAWVRYTLSTILLIVLFRSIYYMLTIFS